MEQSLSSKNPVIPILPNEVWFSIIHLYRTALSNNDYNSGVYAIKGVLGLSSVNRNFNGIALSQHVWHTILCAQEKTMNYYLLHRIAHSSLKSNSTIGKHFYNFLVANSLYHKAKYELTFGKPSDKKISWYSPIRTSLSITHNTIYQKRLYILSLFFRGCYTTNNSFQSLEQLEHKKYLQSVYQYPGNVGNQDEDDQGLLEEPYSQEIINQRKKSISILVNNFIDNIVLTYYEHWSAPADCCIRLADRSQIAGKTARECKVDFGLSVLAHVFILYLTKDVSSQDTNDEFKQTALIRACRRREYDTVKEILNSGVMPVENILSDQDILGFDALYISIVDNSHDIFDLLLEKVEKLLLLDAKKLKEFIDLCIEVDNKYALWQLPNLQDAYIKTLPYTTF